ncbi:MAG TPA: PRC-barrel domain-containing protein [Stellaceae bacterium]
MAFAGSVSLAVATGPAPASAAPAGPSGGPPPQSEELQRVPGDHLMAILGKDVVSATGEKMGPIVDVLFDQAGKPRAAVIDFGGFLGVGTRKIAIDWGALLFDMGDQKNVIALDISRKQLEAAPEYQGPDKPVSIVTLPRSGQSGPPPDASR